SSRHTAAVSLPSASSRSAAISLRTTCSGLCGFLVAMILSSLPAHIVGRKTLISHGSTDRGQASVGSDRVEGDPIPIVEFGIVRRKGTHYARVGGSHRQHLVDLSAHAVVAAQAASGLQMKPVDAANSIESAISPTTSGTA